MSVRTLQSAASFAAALALVLPTLASADPVVLITRASNGGVSDGYAYFPQVSDDGRSVAFTSIATNLDPNDVGGRYDAFVADVATGVIHILSRNPVTGGQDTINGDCSIDGLSSNGRYVAFTCPDLSLILDAYPKSPGWNDVVVYDRDSDADGVYDEAGAVTLRPVSVKNDGSLITFATAGSADISGDGRFVAFTTNGNYTSDDLFTNIDVYLHDRDDDADGVFDEPGAITTRRASYGSNSLSTDSEFPSLATDGSLIGFQSTAALVAGDTNGKNDAYAYRVGDQAQELISVAMGGGAGDDASGGVKVSSSGRYVLFFSAASNLVAGDTNGVGDAFLRDRQLGTTTRVSVASGGDQLSGQSEPLSVTADGRFVFFTSGASELPGFDGQLKTYRHDRETGITQFMVAAGPIFTHVNADGSRIVSSLIASDLVPGHSNTVSDVYLFTTDVDLELTLTEDADPALLSGGLGYSFGLMNNARMGATGVEANFVIPAGTAFGSATIDGGSCSAASGLITCALPSLDRFSGASGTIDLVPADVGVFVLSGQAIAYQPDLDASDDAAQASTTVINLPDVRVQLSAPASVRKAKKFTVAITVTNIGGQASGAGAVTIAAPFNGTLTKIGKITLNGATCAKAKKAPVTCSFAALAPGASVTGSVVVLAKKVGSASQSVSVSAAGDANSSNNSATAVVTVTK